MKKGLGTGAMDSLRHGRGWVIPVMLVAMAPFAFGGCYGRFPMTRAVYDFNGDISSNKIVQTGAFWAFVILPVYELAVLVDALVFNVLETGDDVLGVAPAVDSNGNLVTLAPASDGRDAVLTVSRDGKVLSQESFVKVSDRAFEVRDAQGNLDGKVLKSPDGTISLTDRDGTVLRTLPADVFAAM